MKNRAVLNLKRGKFWTTAGIFLCLFLSPLVGFSTHLRAGEITVERLNCSSLTFKITITVYTNTGSEIKFGEGLLDFGDGTTDTTPTIENTKRPDLGDDIGTVSYSVEHTYAGPGRYVISYLEPNRNGGILNIFNSVETRFYIETIINIDPFLGCNNSPKLLVPPIDKACTGSAWFHNPGAFDPDGDSISFELTIPKKEKGVVVGNYRDPNNKEFYDKGGITYGIANEAQDGPPTFDIDEVTGTLTWDSPGLQGEYNIAFLIKEWRKLNNVWVLMGYVVRDMQIIVEDCKNERPELLVPEDICVEAGELIKQDIFGFDPDSDDVKIEAFSQVFSLLPSPAEITFPTPNDFQKSSPANHARIRFEWQTDCDHIKEQPYQVVFKITDKPASKQRLIQFKTWNITVVGPSPKWVDAHTIPSSRTASLKWDPYKCDNATSMQVWRRVDEFPYTPAECVTGMPDFLGYTQIATVPIGQSSYTDNNGGKGLAVGAQYCYRLVAVFPAPGGGESYLSKDTCLAPIRATAPIVTNVSIRKTGNTGGEIFVRWRTAYDLDPADYPPPYSYEVYRAEGITGNIKITRPHPGKLTDTTFVDSDPVLNTEELMYNYRIVLYDGNGTRVDTSDVASTVRVETKPQLKAIELTWFADVPWTNKTDKYPMHHIYRGPNGATDDQLVLIDSVDVNKSGFRYLDEGQYNKVPLDENAVYCYKVMTRGAYGNPRIVEPLQNYSQKMCAQPNDNTPPCKPELQIIAQSCDDRQKSTSCGNSDFSNTLTWPRPNDAACRNDIRSYNIYIADKVGEDFRLYQENVRDTFYIDQSINLRSYARCYKIEAVDRSGNKSEMSEAFCFDNCPHYELPNVFTPGEDGCNPYFSAFSDRTVVDENGIGPCSPTIPIDPEEVRQRCARFVLAVKLKVYNRWGKEVYNYESGGERSIYIDWDGRDSQGSELSAGVYYYVAEVTYDVVDPSQATQFLKGWVHLVR
ncbi:MAG TPA: gliding motility-associated C-terminal domain-containing protein [Cyclobacteriaceae bacterium]|nr:gliding motility-associated C-terminal domain-containing protein [Cyclobacteriaceae bacterium]